MQTITLGGRAFKGVSQSTLRQDRWVMNEMREAGLLEVLSADGDGDASWAQRFLVKLMSSQHTDRILAGCLLPAELEANARAAGKQIEDLWTPQIAEEIAVHIASVKDPKEKQRVNDVAAHVLLNFCGPGLAYTRSSPTSSTAPRPTESQPGQEIATANGAH